MLIIAVGSFSENSLVRGSIKVPATSKIIAPNIGSWALKKDRPYPIKLIQKTWDQLSDKQLEYAANDVIYLHRIKNELEKMLVREKRFDLFKRCINFLYTRIELDQTGFKFDIFEH